MSGLIAQPDQGSAESLRVSLFHTGPVELGALSESLNSLAGMHGRFAARIGANINDDTTKLYVREIRSGSIIIELIALTQTIPMALAPINTVFAFAQNLAKTFDYFKGIAAGEPEGLTKRDVDDMAKFLNPVAQDARSILNIDARDNATVNVTYNLNSTEANAIQQRASRWISRHVEPVAGVRTGQLFYFFQARDQSKARTGDRGIIEAISRNPVKTVFASDEAKSQMLGEALFRKLYVVDVEVQTVDDKPRLYKILQVTDSFDRD